MKISSRSILSPGRAGYTREPPPISLSTSLSRRLSNSRSIRGSASPAMFPVTGKKRGCGFDNPEPSSPKVTCIGQVRVKTKKKHPKNLRTLSRRRTLEHSRSQTQHISINNNNNQRWVHIPLTICEALRTFGSEVSCLFPCRSSCASTTPFENEENNQKMDVGSQWLVALQDGDEEQRDVIIGNNDDDYDEMGVRNSRRHVFDNLEIMNDVILGGKDEARVSICVPPKNALLLMRCRSDPLKMEALTSRFWEPTMETNQEEDEEFAVYDNLQKQEETCEDSVEISSEIEMKQSIEEDCEQEHEMESCEKEEESYYFGSLFDENEVEDQDFEEEEEVDFDMEDALEQLFGDEDIEETETGVLNVVKIKQFEEGNEEIEVENGEDGEREKVTGTLPECLLMMMYEPKLSMEVSKETWVCSSDFIRRHSGRKKLAPPVESNGGQEDDNHVMTMTGPVSQQPARSSCSMIAVWEPMVLTRCNSEPMPESCNWTKKLEPPRRASFGVGMTG